MNYIDNTKRIFPARHGCYRWVYAAFAVLSVLPLMAAYYLQTEFNLAPCPLCIVQRYGFWLALFVSLLGLIRGRLPTWLDAWAILSAVCAGGVAAYHVSLLAHPNEHCGIDPVENFVNRVPLAQWWPDMFASSGLCGADLPLVYGVSIPMWSMLGLFGLSLLWAVYVVKRR